MSQPKPVTEDGDSDQTVESAGGAEMCVYGLTPSIAFVNLSYALKRVRSNNRELAA